MNSFPVTAEEKRSHSMMLPPPIFHVSWDLGCVKGVLCSKGFYWEVLSDRSLCACQSGGNISEVCLSEVL